MEKTEQNKFGLSKKTNIALAAIAGITTAAEQVPAIIAITALAVFCIGLQYNLDREAK